MGDEWNNDPLIVDPLNKAGFSSKISYGFIGDEHPKCLLDIVNGKIVNAALYSDEKIDWDLRADKKNWEKWISKGFGLTKLGPAVATRSLQFAQGDYRQMIRNPLLSRPFLRHFVLMTKLGTTY
ncbi:SCP-2 sterol transfer family protein [sulfur-oxidizing endosymbiont of Gigantopelta aegis]|uniref:SCP-2 sterol transfer family protein n=1 Tax=sulfur-oxidizing endosymbiont of Gigantopelta aegis TaxID=2794934 RepID=UPI0018DB5B03|nr:SCP-2 sterol transfer family protein [sulfur-oxidizing endosymbiont of Gigantopelta aegis]